MAIYIPGKRARGRRRAGVGKRSAVVALNMTAMVDMFTVLCVFLLQNYATTNNVLPIPDKVQLPKAQEVKELKPSNVVIIAEDGVMLNSSKVADLRSVREQEDWLITGLAEQLTAAIKAGEAKRGTLGNQLRSAVNEAKGASNAADEVPEYRKITIQSDRTVDFLTVKKVMYTVTEAGVVEINFAVLKKANESAPL
jgi:biopolymer transport protein ExbD